MPPCYSWAIVDPVVTSLTQRLKTLVPDLRLLLLFGSFADGSQRIDSDVDLAFAAIRPLGSKALFDLRIEMQVGCPRSVDLIDLSNETVSIILRHEIIISAHVLFEEDDAVLSEFEARIMRDHGDFIYRRRDLEAAVCARLAAYAND